jgi:hypothetical protein
MDTYTGNEVFQILIKKSEARDIVEDWAERNMDCDLRLRKAKTHGHVVIELKDVVYANNIRIWHPGCQIEIKKQ